jgi:hypothetical protein
MAVGSQATTAGPAYTLAETWDGTAWSTSPSPTPPSPAAHLSGVSCTTSTSCTAAGTFSTYTLTQTLIELWGGSLWATASSPNVNVLATPVVNIVSTSAPDQGYWLTDTTGDVTAHGGARLYGSMSGHALAAPVNGIAALPDAKGYWLVAADGGVFAFGDARFYGSMGGQHLNQPVVGMTATADGHGYWLVAADGGVFAFGDARFYGSMGGQHLNQPVVGMTATADGQGLLAGRRRRRGVRFRGRSVPRGWLTGRLTPRSGCGQPDHGRISVASSCSTKPSWRSVARDGSRSAGTRRRGLQTRPSRNTEPFLISRD